MDRSVAIRDGNESTTCLALRHFGINAVLSLEMLSTRPLRRVTGTVVSVDENACSELHAETPIFRVCLRRGPLRANYGRHFDFRRVLELC